MTDAVSNLPPSDGFASPSDGFASLLAVATSVGQACSKLSPTSQQWARGLFESLIANDVEGKLDAVTADMAKRLLGGAIGGMAAPGLESTEHVLEAQFEDALTKPLTPPPGS